MNVVGDPNIGALVAGCLFKKKNVTKIIPYGKFQWLPMHHIVITGAMKSTIEYKWMNSLDPKQMLDRTLSYKGCILAWCYYKSGKLIHGLRGHAPSLQHSSNTLQNGGWSGYIDNILFSFVGVGGWYSDKKITHCPSYSTAGNVGLHWFLTDINLVLN